MRDLRKSALFVIAAAFAALMLVPGSSWAHCDGLDGPVVTAARQALDRGDVNLVLVWVQKADEPEIRNAFEKTLAVRKASPEAKALADTWFFETIVRVHRAGEGAPYTGLKPAGRDLGPAIVAGDQAIASGSAEAVFKLLTDQAHSGLHGRFHAAVEKRGYAKDDVAAGREYVRAYVDYIHYVEGLYEAAKGPAAGHAHEIESTTHHQH
jgi:hypothetical protein